MKTKDIRINKELIMKYKPCIEGVDNFNKHYTDISITELINSENISYYNKVWLLRYIVPVDLLVLWAIDSSFAAYEYSVISSNYYAITAAVDAANAADYAITAPYYAANAAANAATNAAYYAITAADYAANGASAQNDRLQSLLYFIENEGE